MARLLFILMMVVTIAMPRRFYRRYMQAMALLSLIYVVLVTAAYLQAPNEAGSQDLYIVIGFVAMNTVLIVMKYLLLKNRPPKP